MNKFPKINYEIREYSNIHSYELSIHNAWVKGKEVLLVIENSDKKIYYSWQDFLQDYPDFADWGIDID